MISKKTNNEIAENVTICYFCILLRWDIFVYLIYSFIYLFFWGGGGPKIKKCKEGYVLIGRLSKEGELILLYTMNNF